MLGLRAVSKSDSNVSAAELALGHTLRLPGDLYDSSTSTKVSNEYSYVNKVKQILQSLRPQSRENRDSRKIFIHKDLSNCSHVFVRNDMVQRPLTPSYSGPYQVISRSPKSFIIKLADRKSNISIDRLKPAYLITEQLETNSTENCNNDSNNVKSKVDKNKEIVSKDQVKSNVNHSEQNMLKSALKTTRTGRIVKQPVRFLLN